MDRLISPDGQGRGTIPAREPLMGLSTGDAGSSPPAHQRAKTRIPAEMSTWIGAISRGNGRVSQSEVQPGETLKRSALG